MKIELEPIGIIKSTYKKKYDAPKQAHLEQAAEAKVVLDPHKNYETALHDLDGFSHIWLIYQFDQNAHWKPKVLPPRKDRQKRGVFATRSPYRPNPIGISVVKLIKIKGRTLFIADHDLLDGTPILDIKPYLVYADSHPAASLGWLGEDDSNDFTVIYSAQAEAKLRWLDTHNIAFKSEIERRLSYDPLPHPYRRITKFETHYQMRYKEWAADYKVYEQTIQVLNIYSGFSTEKIAALNQPNLHEQFMAVFP